MIHEKTSEAVTASIRVLRPGATYYFDDKDATCPGCGGIDLTYVGRVRAILRCATFKCKDCSCKFTKTRTVVGEPFGYDPTVGAE